MSSRAPTKSIIFKEKHQERAFDASNDDLLAESCLLVLRERYENPAWNYKPRRNELALDEIEFIEFYDSEGRYLPKILKRYADRIYDQLHVRAVDDGDPDWTWYEGVKALLALPQEEAVGYKIPFRGRIIPTSYYLLLQRQNFPNESLTLVNLGNEKD